MNPVNVRLPSGEDTEQSPFGSPERRRVWLLSKALECRALSEALELAKVAERFICGDRSLGADGNAEADANAESVTAVSRIGSLAVLASVEEVVRYLKSGDAPFDETTSEDGPLSAQSHEDLLALANQRRLCHHLPPFQLWSTAGPEIKGESQVSGDPAVTPPLRRKAGNSGKVRAPSGRERAAWARRVVALAD
jgi:hypothetical protein